MGLLPTSSITDHPVHILIAPNAFKNAIDADTAAKAIGEGFTMSRLSCICHPFPIGDGGDGTCELIIRRVEGKKIFAPAHDALGGKITAAYGLIDDGRTAVVEMADASGIRLLPPSGLHPLYASSYGTGELIGHALRKGVDKVIIGMGGSATVDGGCGMLEALGTQFLDKNGRSLWPVTPSRIKDITAIDTSEITKWTDSCEFIVLCDVNNPLLGPAGAAAVFGPQKGASPGDILRLEEALAHFAEITFRQTGIGIAGLPRGGTAGGAAAGLHAFLQAQLVDGIDYFLQITGFDETLAKAHIVVTGEGSLDRQTLKGKGPYGVAIRAKNRGLPVIGLAGRLPLEDQEQLRHYFDVLLPIGNEITDLPTALRGTEDNLRRTATEIGNLMTAMR